MGDVIDVLVEEFSSGELTTIAEELGLSPTSRWPQRKLVDLIRLQIKQKGLPESPPEDVELSRAQELVEDFLYVGGYVDDEGNVTKEVSDELTLDEFMEQHGIAKLPSCFGGADDSDPACSRCLIYKYCGQERIIKLPACFGILYDANHPECRGCIEAPFCTKAMPTN